MAESRQHASAKFFPTQKIIGLQVIDSKGSVVGNVQDVAIDVRNQQIALVVATKAKGELEVSWTGIQSIEDVVLLNKEVPLSEYEGQPSVKAETISCSNCGAQLPAHARFCAKCGSKVS